MADRNQAKVLVNNFTIMADLFMGTDQQTMDLSIKDNLSEIEGVLSVLMSLQIRDLHEKDEIGWTLIQQST
ncbi:MAG TPA: hypothetical protein VIR31_08110 [Nitrososphaeraceae archaeon]|jgi:hypothetical protein